MPDASPSPPARPGAVDVLLTAYNSARYLGQQIESLRKQTFRDFRVLIRDDGSTDGTQEMIDRLVSEEPQRFGRVDAGRRLGPCGGFAELLEAAEAPRVMFCDHDDVWLPDKIRLTAAVMDETENSRGEQTPVLVFTDLCVTDEELRPICSSYWRHQRIDPRRLSLRQQLTQNVPSGCTMMLNRPLVDLARPIPPEAVMHDHWVSLVAAGMGRPVLVPAQTVLYRQHAGNVFGAAGGRLHRLALRGRLGLAALRRRYYRNVQQARVFLDRYGDRLPPAEASMIRGFASLPTQGPLEKRLTLVRHRIFKCGFARNLATLVIV